MTNIWMQLLHMLRLLWPSQLRTCTGYYVMHSTRVTTIHKLHPLPEKIGSGCANSLHSGTGYIANSHDRSMIVFLSISIRIFSEQALLILKNSITVWITKMAQWNQLHWNSRVCSIQISIMISVTIFCIAEHGLPISVTISNMISITKIGTVEPVTLKQPCLFHTDFNHDFNHDFLHSEHPFYRRRSLL